MQIAEKMLRNTPAACGEGREKHTRKMLARLLSTAQAAGHKPRNQATLEDYSLKHVSSNFHVPAPNFDQIWPRVDHFGNNRAD